LPSVDSTCCAQIDYEPEAGTLLIVFQKRGSYEYYNVDPYTAAQVMTATSHGKDFNRFIRDRFAYSRVG